MEPDAPKPSAQEIDEFKRLVSAWVGYDDTVRKLQSAVAERRAAMRALQKSIIDFMRRFNVDALTTAHGRIMLSTKKSKAPLRIADVQHTLSQIALQGTPNVDVGALMKTLFEAPRPVTESSSLRRVMPRVSMALEL